MSKLKALKVDAIGIQTSTKVTNLVSMLERGGRVDPAIQAELFSLLDITGSSDERLRGTRHARVAELCNLLGNVASAIIASRGGAPG